MAHNEHENYMFFKNLEQIARQIDELRRIDPSKLDLILQNGHDWADDHISVSKENIDQVFNFIMNIDNESQQITTDRTVQVVDFSASEGKILNFNNFIKLNEGHPSEYKAPEGSSRDRKLDKAKELLKKGKKEEAYRLRDEMEKEERSKPGFKNKPRKDSKTANESPLNEGSKKETLSKETEDKIRKVADKKGYTFGSLKQEYIKGLGAYYSSGSRPGMTAHQWAMARVNAATPSKSWANVKKSKSKND